MGTIVMGKSEAGVVKKGDSLMVMPNRCVGLGGGGAAHHPALRYPRAPLTLALTPSACRVPVKVLTVYRDEQEVAAARPGENLRLRLQGIEEDDISSGFVLSSRFTPVPAVTFFEAQVRAACRRQMRRGALLWHWQPPPAASRQIHHSRACTPPPPPGGHPGAA